MASGPAGVRDLVAIAVDGGEREGVLVLDRVGDQPWQVIHDLDGVEDQPASRALLIPDEEQHLRGTLDAAMRTAVAIVAGPATAAPPAVITHIHALARIAARRRNASTLAHLDRLLRFATSGHTLGERFLLEQLTTLDDTRWLTVRVPDRPLPPPVVARPIAALLFRSGPAWLR
jgi:hypothetical protein